MLRRGHLDIWSSKPIVSVPTLKIDRLALVIPRVAHCFDVFCFCVGYSKFHAVYVKWLFNLENQTIAVRSATLGAWQG